MTYTTPVTKSGEAVEIATWNAEIVENFKMSVPDVLTAKGEIPVGSGADAMGLLSVGTDGHNLLADSSESLGIKWGSIAQSIYARAHFSGNVSITKNTLTILNFDSEDSDESGLITTGASWKFTAPSDRIYLACVTVTTTSGVDKTLTLSLYKNNSLFCYCDSWPKVPSIVTGEGSVTAAEAIELSAEDYIDFRLYVTGNNCTLDGTAVRSHVSIVKLY